MTRLPASETQIAAIRELAKRLGLGGADLRALLDEENRTSVRALDASEANRVIGRLLDRQARAPNIPTVIPSSCASASSVPSAGGRATCVSGGRAPAGATLRGSSSSSTNCPADGSGRPPGSFRGRR